MSPTHPEAPVAPDTPALRALAAVSAGLTGFGLVLWIAANWDTLGRTGQFALLQVGQVQLHCLMPSQTACEQHSQKGTVPFAL